MNLFNKMLYGNALGGNPWYVGGMVFKGGKNKSKSTTTTESKVEIDDRYDPYVEQAMTDLKAGYDSGALSQVAGTSSLQQEAFDAMSGNSERGLDAIYDARGSMYDAMNGTGLFDPAEIDALEKAAIDQMAKERGIMNDQFASAGAMGGSRQAIAAGDADAQLANALAQIKYDQLNRTQDNARWGAESLTSSGVTESDTFNNNVLAMTEMGNLQRQIEQEELDKDLKGLEAYMTGIQSFQDIISTQTTTTTQESSSKKKGK